MDIPYSWSFHGTVSKEWYPVRCRSIDLRDSWFTLLDTPQLFRTLFLFNRWYDPRIIYSSGSFMVEIFSLTTTRPRVRKIQYSWFFFTEGSGFDRNWNDPFILSYLFILLHTLPYLSLSYSFMGHVCRSRNLDS